MGLAIVLQLYRLRDTISVDTVPLSDPAPDPVVPVEAEALR